VHFDEAGDPVEVERLGIALEPQADYERRPNGGGCEDPRITFLESLELYVMTYTALSTDGPRIALAVSNDLFEWRRLGLATFRPYQGIDFDCVDNKDASVFPVPIPDPSGQPAMAILHRPLFPGTRPEEKASRRTSRTVDLEKESIWISFCSTRIEECEEANLCCFGAHHRLASPTAPWERLKIGGGTPPVLTEHGWLMVYHGVHETAQRELCYSAGVMVLSTAQPTRVCYRSDDPILVPDAPNERRGVMDDVVFPTGIDRRDDLGTPQRLDIYYGMADERIGVASIQVPDSLPEEGLADSLAAKI